MQESAALAATADALERAIAAAKVEAEQDQ